MPWSTECAHGYPVERKTDDQGWVHETAPRCPICTGEVHLPYKEGAQG